MFFYKKNKYIFLIIFGLLLSLLIIESGIRIFDKNPDILLRSIYLIDYENGLIVYKPNKILNYKRECFNNIVRFNSLGWRDKEFKVNKEDGVYRILTIGDSFTAALEVPLEKTFHYILEQKLNKYFENKKIKFEVLSISKGGNGMYYNYRYLKDYGIKYKPDLVLFLTFRNDFLDDMREINSNNNIFGRGSFEINNNELIDRYSRYNNKIIGRLIFFLRSNFALPHFIYRKYSSLVYNFRNQKNINTEYIFSNIYEVQNLEDKIFEKIKNLAINNNLKIIFFNIIDNSIYTEDKTGLISIDEHSKIISDLTNKYEFKFINLKNYFIEKYKKENQEFIFFCDHHWNEIGHQYMADALFKYLLNEINF